MHRESEHLCVKGYETDEATAAEKEVGIIGVVAQEQLFDDADEDEDDANTGSTVIETNPVDGSTA